MRVEVTPQPADLDSQAMQVFLKAIELAGGQRGLLERKRLTWLPSLMEAAYAVVLSETYHRTIEDIAQFLGISSAATRQLLRASPEAVRARLQSEETGEETDEERVHIAGGLARWAFQTLREQGAFAQ